MNSESFGRADRRAEVKRVRALIEAGKLDEARVVLDAMRSDEAALSDPALGEITLLGLPRKLHATLLKLAKAERDVVRKIGLQHTLSPDPKRLEHLVGFDREERRTMNGINRQPVPRIIHQIWVGDIPLPPATQAWAENARKTGFEYRLWREKDLEEIGATSHPAYAQMLADGDYPGVVDVARYFILRDLGGIYLDCDWYPARDDVGFADLLPLIGLSALPEGTPRETGKGSLLLTNSFLASPPGHPVFQRLLDVMPEVIEILPQAPAWWSTGPVILTMIFRGTSVFIPDWELVATELPRRADFSRVEAACAAAREKDSGLLIAWKSW